MRWRTIESIFSMVCACVVPSVPRQGSIEESTVLPLYSIVIMMRWMQVLQAGESGGELYGSSIICCFDP